MPMSFIQAFRPSGTMNSGAPPGCAFNPVTLSASRWS
jgi:hypothetical protein